MLNYKDFEVIQNFSPYDFTLLDLQKRQKCFATYKELENDKLVRVVCTENLQLLQQICVLEEFDLIDGPLGYLKKGTKFYIFMDVHLETTLFQTIKLRKNQINKPYFSEGQVTELIKLVVNIFDILQERQLSFNLLVLTPNDFVIINTGKINKIKLRFPIQEPIFQQKELMHQYLRQRREFCAPEMNDKSFQNNYSRRSEKSAVYSLGLMVLFTIFGQAPKQILKGQSSQNDIQFQNELKFKRKQIKVLYDSKTVSKIVKILLEKRQKFRDSFKTLKFKLLSPVFKSASKIDYFDNNPKEQQQVADEILIDHKTTRSFDYGDKIFPLLERKKTIEFEVMVGKGGSLHSINNISVPASNHQTFKESKITINCLSAVENEGAITSFDENSKNNLIIFSNAQGRDLTQTIANSPRQREGTFEMLKKNSDKNPLFNSQDMLLSQEVAVTRKKVKLERKIPARFARIEEFQKFKLINYLLFGIVVLLIGLCLLYLSLFGQE